MGTKKPSHTSKPARRSKRLNFETLDQRIVLSANTYGAMAPLDVSAVAGEEAVVDLVGDRTSYRNLEVAGYEGAPDEAAFDFLGDHAETFGLPTDVVDQLSVIDTKYGLASGHAYLQQVHDGAPIHEAQITVSLNDSGIVQRLHTSFVEHRGAIDKPVEIDAAKAISNAEAYAGVTSTWIDGKTEFVWHLTDGGALEPAWRTMVHAEAPELNDWLTVVSAVDGRVIEMHNRSAHATGTGDVFKPNPYQTQGSGAGMVDNNDATSPALDAQMVSVTLERLNDNTDRLIGEYVDATYLGDLPMQFAEEPDRVYEYHRDDDRFEQVVVYYTVDQIQQYFHDLGFDDDTGTANGIRDFATLAAPHWYEPDQSFYSTGDDAIHMGDGGVDDAEDADIIAHEYGHAIHHDQNPNWGGGEMGAMGEGYGDYLAASFYADDGDGAFQSLHAAAVGEWDAVSYSGDSPPNLRRVDGNKSYPGDLVGQVHADGEIWSAALWDIRGQLGGETIDQLVLESHFGLPGGASMVDAANAVLTADANINGGANQAVIEQWFVARGILTAPDDHGNVASNATVINVPSTTAGGIDFIDDPDYFRFAATAGTTYELEVDLGTSNDSTLTLYGPNGATQIGFDDNGGTGNGSLMGWTAPTSGNYFARVSGSSIGSYDLSVATIATPADDHGDLTSTATSVANPSVTTGEIEVASDSDVFAFPADAGETYRLDVSTGTLENSYLQIIDTNGTTVVASDLDGGNSALLWSAGGAGTYFAVVQGGSQGTYEFEVSQIVDDHGNNAASATPIATPSTTDGWVEFGGDVDFFRFTATAGEGYDFLTVLDSLSDSTMTLYDTNGTTELEFDDDGGPGLASSIRWEAPASGDYYIEVQAFNGEQNGTYELVATTFTPGVDDHGNTFADATPVALNSVTQADLEEAGDVDYFSFNVLAGANITLETSLVTVTDTTMSLYDTNGVTELEFDDDGGAGLASRIDWTIDTAGTYYVAVRGFADARTGLYDLTVTSDLVGITGDFNSDGIYDCNDIDALTGEIAAGSNAASFDLTGDGFVDGLDLNAWLAEAGEANLGAGLSYLPGDANLDSVVDVSDFGLWNANKFTETSAWCDGDFTADGVVDVSDFGIWNANKFTSSDSAALSRPQVASEEPATRSSRRGQLVVSSSQQVRPNFATAQMPVKQRNERQLVSRRIADKVFEQVEEEALTIRL